jgi:hypothetical protein
MAIGGMMTKVPPIVSNTLYIMKNILLPICSIIMLLSCSGNKDEALALFGGDYKNLTKANFTIDEDMLAGVEGIYVDDKYIVTLDWHTGQSYSLFDAAGKFICRFGNIGQGPTEIPSGCIGYLYKHKFYVHDTDSGLLAVYNLDSLQMDAAFPPQRLPRYPTDVMQLSKIVPVNDTLFLGAGAIGNNQFVLFGTSGIVYDKSVPLFNASISDMHPSNKYLSNQGSLVRHPKKNIMAYSVNKSANLELIRVTDDNKIERVKSLRLRNPEYTYLQTEMILSADLNPESKMGYLALTGSNKYIYALYSVSSLSNREYHPYFSDIILVFDWEGNPVRKYKLPHRVFSIASDMNGERLYTTQIDAETKGWTIEAYRLDE